MESSRKDFISSLPLLAHKSQKITYNNDEYIFVTKLFNNESLEPEITFLLFNKDKIFKTIYNYEQFKTYKKNMGLEGSWKSLMESMGNAIDGVDSGELKISFPNNKDKLELIVVHPISKEVKISGNITFEKVKKNLNEIFFDGISLLYDAREQLKMEKITNIKETNKISVNDNIISERKENLEKDNKGNMILEVKQNVKRKYHANLINPNIKKRKKKGVEFIKEETNEDKDVNNESL